VPPPLEPLLSLDPVLVGVVVIITVWPPAFVETDSTAASVLVGEESPVVVVAEVDELSSPLSKLYTE
jgi:hypothetical protein